VCFGLVLRLALIRKQYKSIKTYIQNYLYKFVKYSNSQVKYYNYKEEEINNIMKKHVILIFGFLLFTGTVFGQALNKKIESIEINKLDSIQTSFLNLLDSNKDAKNEYLSGLYHFNKARKDLAKSLIVGVAFGVPAIYGNTENEGLVIALLGGLGLALYYDISSIKHSIKANKHFNKVYKITGLIAPIPPYKMRYQKK